MSHAKLYIHRHSILNSSINNMIFGDYKHFSIWFTYTISLSPLGIYELLQFSDYMISSGGSRIFPRGLRQLPKLLLFLKFLQKTAWQWQNFYPRGVHESLAPPLDLPIVNYSNLNVISTLVIIHILEIILDDYDNDVQMFEDCMDPQAVDKTCGPKMYGKKQGKGKIFVKRYCFTLPVLCYFFLKPINFMVDL